MVTETWPTKFHVHFCDITFKAIGSGLNVTPGHDHGDTQLEPLRNNPTKFEVLPPYGCRDLC